MLLRGSAIVLLRRSTRAFFYGVLLRGFAIVLLRGSAIVLLRGSAIVLLRGSAKHFCTRTSDICVNTLNISGRISATLSTEFLQRKFLKIIFDFFQL